MYILKRGRGRGRYLTLKRVLISKIFIGYSIFSKHSQMKKMKNCSCICLIFTVKLNIDLIKYTFLLIGLTLCLEIKSCQTE